jgi:hypothetical protein
MNDTLLEIKHQVGDSIDGQDIACIDRAISKYVEDRNEAVERAIIEAEGALLAVAALGRRRFHEHQTVKP